MFRHSCASEWRKEDLDEQKTETLLISEWQRPPLKRHSTLSRASGPLQSESVRKQCDSELIH